MPFSWWLILTGCVLLLGTTLWAGLSLLTAVIIYVGLEAACALALLGWSAATIEVTDRELRAGRQRMPLASIAGVTALDAGQTLALRGPRADPAACLLLRPWLPTAVYVEVAGRPAEQPYWLIATRHPAELAAAIERAVLPAPTGPAVRPAAQACDDSAGDRAAEPGQRPRMTGTAFGRRDGNA